MEEPEKLAWLTTVTTNLLGLKQAQRSLDAEWDALTRSGRSPAELRPQEMEWRCKSAANRVQIEILAAEVEALGGAGVLLE